MKTRTNSGLVIMSVLGLLALGGFVSAADGNDPVSHWKFDESSGTTAYDSVGDNHGTVYGAVWTTGQIGGALSFDGMNDYAQVPDDDSLDLTSEATLSAWINTRSITTVQGIVGRWNYTGLTAKRSILLDARGDIGDRLRFWISTDGTPHTLTYVASNVQFSANTWYHVACTYNGSRMTLYVNGEEDNSVPKSGHIFASNTEWNIGAFDYGRRAYFNGIIDDVRIYNRALSAEEIWELCRDDLPNVVGLEMVGPGEVAENFSASYKAIAYYDNNSTRDVTNLALWTVEPNTAANIDENGVLRTQDIVKHQSATILASYTEGDVTVEAEKAIDILAICPTGTALSFDGIDDYVKVNKNHSLNFGSSIDFTMEAWIKAKPSQLKYPAIIGRRNPGAANGYIFFLWLDGRLASQLNDGRDTNYQSTSDDLRDDTWHYVAVTADRNAYLIFYVDGIQKGQNDISIKGNIDSVSDIFIGWEEQNPSATYFNGVIDEVRIYDRALSAEEIVANMHTRLAGDEPGLVGYWDFDEGEGQIVYDLSGNGNDGQLGSTPDVDASDPAWVDSDAPIGICSLYQIATIAADGAVERKTSLLEELLAALAQEWTAYEALEEWLEGGDYGDLNKGDIVTAKQKIHSAIQHEEQAIDALEKSIEKLEDALSALGYEPEPPPPPLPLPGQASNPNPANGATYVSISADLSWTAGSNAVSHDVYFGTTSSGTFRGNQTDTTFDPGTMATYTTYYWRIDEVNPSGTTTGTVWIFRTTTGGPPPI